MVRSDNRCKPRIQVQRRLFPDHARGQDESRYSGGAVDWAAPCCAPGRGA
jgi:hypothetical protein